MREAVNVMKFFYIIKYQQIRRKQKQTKKKRKEKKKSTHSIRMICFVSFRFVLLNILPSKVDVVCIHDICWRNVAFPLFS